MGDYKWQLNAVVRFVGEVISAIVAACGTGKTRAAIKLAIKKALPVIVIVPGHLARQWRDDILEIAGENESVWIYNTVLHNKNPAAYREEFTKWLEED